MQAAFFQHASVAGTTRFSSCRRNSTSAFFAPTTTTKKKRVAVLRSPVRAHHGPDYVAQFEPENAAGGGLIIAAALLGRYLSTGKALNCSGLVDPVEGMSKEFLSEKNALHRWDARNFDGFTTFRIIAFTPSRWV